MVNKVTIELSSELASKLTHQAIKQQTTLENIIINLLSQLNENQTREENDPITPLLGTLSSNLNDIGENHDLYLGENVAEKKED